MATSDGKFVRLCQVGAKVPVEEALAGGQAVNFMDTCFSTCKESLIFTFMFRVVLCSAFHFCEQFQKCKYCCGKQKFIILSFFSKFLKLQVNCQDGDGNTGLMLAICYKKQPLVDLLLER